MPLSFDIHLHTSRYSRDSKLDAARLIQQAVRSGLDGVVITEHHHVWSDDELRELVEDSAEPGFILLSGFEYTSSQGDVLIYGLTPEQAAHFVPGRPPEEAIERARDFGAACIAAHPTRAGLGFDERISGLALDGLEVESVNLKPHEQRLARTLADAIGRPMTGSSDAHRLDDVGRYATEFTDLIRSLPELVAALRAGRFQPVPPAQRGVATA